MNDVLAFKDCAARNIPFDGEMYGWDWAYYDKLYKEKTLQLDMQFVKEHFPVEDVVPRLLDIYQELLGLRSETNKGEVWNPGEYWAELVSGVANNLRLLMANAQT